MTTEELWKQYQEKMFRISSYDLVLNTTYFDADTMNEFDIWYADYERTPQTPYHFVWWQYTNEGSVPGMEGAIDLNLWIRPLEEDQP